MKIKAILTAACMCLLFAACEHDNYDAPNARLSGKVMYNGNPVGVRSDGTQLELWQDGFELYTKIPVHIAQDGTYSAALFNGRYKLVRLAGAPWEAQSNDTLIVDVRGNTVFDIPVTPFFVIRNESYQTSSGTITSKFIVDKVVESADVVSVNLYLGKNLLTDHNKNENETSLDLSQLQFGQEVTITSLIPESLMKEDYIFARIGVRSNRSNEYYYTQVQKININ